MTIHAWFSSVIALREGSWLYRKPSGGTVNVTRVDMTAPLQRWGRPEEIYLGEVVHADAGGCLGPRSRVAGVRD